MVKVLDKVKLLLCPVLFLTQVRSAGRASPDLDEIHALKAQRSQWEAKNSQTQDTKEVEVPEVHPFKAPDTDSNQQDVEFATWKTYFLVQVVLGQLQPKFQRLHESLQVLNLKLVYGCILSIQKCDACIQTSRELRNFRWKFHLCPKTNRSQSSPHFATQHPARRKKREVKVHQICPQASGLK